jgi:hypothetical protein
MGNSWPAAQEVQQLGGKMPLLARASKMRLMPVEQQASP